MKTSNKLLLVLTMAAFLSTISIMLYAKSQVITHEEYHKEMELSGNLVEKVLHENLTTDNIEMGDNFTWIFDPNSTQVVVKGDEAIVSKLTVVDDKQFQIRTGAYGSYDVDYDFVVITVGTKNLSKLRIKGDGNARISAKSPMKLEKLELDMNGNARSTFDIQTGDIELGANGNSRITLIGSAENINAHVSGNGKVYFEDLSCNEVAVDASGNAGYYSGTVGSIVGSASGNARIKVEDVRGKNKVSTSGNARFTISR